MKSERNMETKAEEPGVALPPQVALSVSFLFSFQCTFDLDLDVGLCSTASMTSATIILQEYYNSATRVLQKHHRSITGSQPLTSKHLVGDTI